MAIIFNYCKNNVSHIICGVITVLVSFALYLCGERSFISQWIVQILYGLILIFARVYFGGEIKLASKTDTRTSILLSVLFSQFITIGNSFVIVHNWSLCFGGLLNWGLWFFQSAVYMWAMYPIILGIIVKINTFKQSNVFFSMSLKRCFWLLFLTRLIFFILFYPCIFDFDGIVGVRTFLSDESITCNHHPFFIQLIHGTAYLFGLSVGHKTLGFAILTFAFIVFSCIILVYAIKICRSFVKDARLLYLLLVFFALFPLFPYLSIYPTKDGFFAYSFLLYILTLFRISLTETKSLSSLKFVFLHGLSVLLVCLTRHQGIYIVIFELLVLIACYIKNSKRLILSVVPFICVFILFNKIVLSLFNVESAGKQELLGHFFQQSAYYVRCHPDEITTKEKESINSLFDVDSIAKNYTYDITDPVKNQYKYNPWYRVSPSSPSMFRHVDRSCENAELKSFFSTWISFLKKHPATMIEASAAVIMGFFYNYNQPLILSQYKWDVNTKATNKEYTFYHVTLFSKLYRKCLPFLVKVPIICWLFVIPYYMWFAILLISMLISRKDKEGIVIFTPLMLSVLVLIICPVAQGRYVFPIIVGIPLLVVYLLSKEVDTVRG